MDQFLHRSRIFLNGERNVAAIVTVLALFVIVGFGFMLRYQAFSYSEVPKYPHGDAAKYLSYAYNLKNFGVFGRGDLTLYGADEDAALVRELVKPDALVTPGFPLYVSLFLGGEFTEKQRDSVILGHVILSTLTVLLAYLAFAPIGRAYGLGVAALTALSPHLVNLNLFFLTEPLFCFLLIVFIGLLSRVRSDSHSYFFLVIGLVLAMAALTRPWIQGYLVVLILYLVLAGWRIKLSKVLLIFVGTAILITPWLVRNKVSLGFVADPSLSVRSIHHGMYPDMMYEGQTDSLGYAYRADPMGPELGNSTDTTLAELKRRASEEPAKYLKWYLVGKARSVLSWNIIAGADAVFVYHVKSSPYFDRPRFYLSSYYMEQIHGLLMALSLAGIVLVWLPGRLHGVTKDSLFFLRSVSLLVLYFLLMHLIGAPYPRYSIPMRPILYAMGLYPITFVAQYVKQRLTQGNKSN
jgi:hypothetical protein